MCPRSLQRKLSLWVVISCVYWWPNGTNIPRASIHWTDGRLTATSREATRVTKEKQSGHLTPRCAHVTMLQPGQFWAFTLTAFVYSSLIYYQSIVNLLPLIIIISTLGPWIISTIHYGVAEAHLFSKLSMMTTSNGNISRVTGHLCGEFTDPGEFPTQRPVTRSFDVFFEICVWINCWVNNGEAGDLRRYRAHCDVTVMFYFYYRFEKDFIFNTQVLHDRS